MFRIYLSVLVLVLPIGIVKADSFDVRLGDESAQFIYASEIFGGSFGPANFEIGAYFNEQDDKMLHIGLVIKNDSLDNPLAITLGTRAYYADAGNAPNQPQTDVAAITLGGELLFKPDNLRGFGLAVSYFTAPSVTSFMDADSFTEYGARIEFEVTEQSSLFAGYRKIEVDREDGRSVEIDSGLIFGLGLRF